jgi:hypothetical protein
MRWGWHFRRQKLAAAGASLHWWMSVAFAKANLKSSIELSPVARSMDYGQISSVMVVSLFHSLDCLDSDVSGGC